MNSLKTRVGHLLSLDMRFRNSDKLLWLQVAEEQGLVLTSDQRDKFMEIPGLDIVSRRRRELRNLYPESPEVMEHRFKNFRVMREEMADTGFTHKRRIHLRLRRK